MKAPGWRVARDEAEGVRRFLRDHRLLSTELGVGHEGAEVVFPLVDVPLEPPAAGRLVEAEFPRYAARGPRSYHDLLSLPAELAEKLPRSFDVIGDVVLVRLPDELVAHGREIGDALLRFVPGARVVGLDEGVHGTARQRRLVRLAGVGPWRTRHKENGLSLVVDLERAYFSPRLAREHCLVAGQVPRGARVLDLCCGVGPFALTVATAGLAREVVAVDSNPEAIRLLEENVARLGVGAIVRPVEGDVAAFLEAPGLARTVILNLPHEGIKYLASVGTAVELGGRFHYYEVTERGGADARPDELTARLGGVGAWVLQERHTVHPYSPKADLVAYTFERRS